MSCKEALSVILDQVDYTESNCRAMDSVGAVLSVAVIKLCRIAIDEEAAPSAPNNTQSAAIAKIVEAVECEIKHVESLKEQYPRIDANDFIRCMTIVAQQLRAL